MLPGDIDSKTRDLVKDSLKSKHPEGRDFSVESLREFDLCPEMIDTVVMKKNVKKVTKQLSGSADPSGIDSLSISRWFLKFGASSSICGLNRMVSEWLSSLVGI